MTFNLAYLVAACATVALVGGYAITVFKNVKLALLQVCILSATYGFIFVIVQMEDYSLLTGSIGLFVILGIIMFVSRKIDWYEIGKGEQKKIG